MHGSNGRKGTPARAVSGHAPPTNDGGGAGYERPPRS
eukprot:COSAG01_NODE_24243_length_785_cov_2.648688_1_plen_36_part_10